MSTTYDFSTLSPADFELLVRDLLAADLGLHIESFRTGRDGGIDLRYTVVPQVGAPHAIVQCKHYVRSGLAALKSTIRNSEYSKIQRLNPSKYRLVTSVSLSPNNKAELRKILKPFVSSSDDVLGQEDLNAMLSRHPAVERRHFKLWIASTTVLQTILNSDVFSHSYIAKEEIQRRLSLFVTTPAVDRARQTLEQYGACIISGIPGIGKTTTAEMLVSLSLRDGWDAIKLMGGVQDAFRVHDPATRQLFIFDDFLGRTRFGDNRLGKGESPSLMALVKLCR